MIDISALARKADAFQQQHPVLAFPYAIIKKFGDDDGGYQAALLTYYGFLSLFPMLLVATTLLLFADDPALRAEVSQNISNYFPLLGDQLQQSVQSMGKTGAGLAIGVLVTLYGARGFADALRYTLDNMWRVPKSDRSGFPKNVGQSLLIMLVGGVGFLATVAASSLTSGFSHALWMKILFNLVSVVILTLALTFIFRLATSRSFVFKDMVVGAGIAAVIVQLLLTFGGILVAGQLKTMDSLYGTFAIVLGLLFWLYLLARVLVYSAEIDTVRYFGLYPRSLSGQDDMRTKADRRAYRLYAKSERHVKVPQEKVRVLFKDTHKSDR
jgi:membrane protein